MESIGRKLREAREKNGYNIDQVARETHISKRYLKALEEEDFSVFPGETYTIGFLKNYADYLGIDAEEIVTLYKNLKIQEEPVPIDELLDVRKERKFSLRSAIIILLVIGLIGTGGYFAYKYLGGKSLVVGKTKEEGAAAGGMTNQGKVNAGNKTFVFEEEALTRWFDKGETIQYQIGDNKYLVKIESVGKDISLESNGKLTSLKLGESKYFDFNKDNQPDLRVQLNDIDSKGSIARVNLGLYKITKPVRVASEGSGQSVNEPSLETNVAGENYKVITEAENAYPFKIDLQFRGYCFFRYVVDNSDRVEKFFHKGEYFSLEVKRSTMLWISNAGTIRAKIAGRETQFGQPGEVVTKKIVWVKDKEKRLYQLRLIDAY